MKNVLHNEIKTVTDILYYIRYLHNNKLIYHFDDLASECFENKELAELLEKRTDEARELAEENKLCLFTLRALITNELDLLE